MRITFPRRHVALLATTLVVTASCVLLSSNSAIAKGKPGGGGGNGGGGGGAGPEHVVIDLGQGRATALNNFGGVVGDTDTNQAILWEVDGNKAVTTTVLPLPNGGVRSFANDVNDSFEIVGTVVFNDGFGGEINQAVLWEVPSAGVATVIVLPGLSVAPGNYSHSIANGISASGLIAGTSIEYDSSNSQVLARTAVVWQVDGFGQVSTTALPTESAADVNSAGMVIAWGELFLLDIAEDGTVIGLGDFVVLPDLNGPYRTDTVSISEDGWIAGSATKPDGQRVATIWNVNMETLQINGQPLNTLPRGDRSYANSANAARSVGSSSEDKKSGRSVYVESTAFLEQNGSLTDLNDLVTDFDGLQKLTGATGINAQGWICGSGETRRTSNAFVAIPTN